MEGANPNRTMADILADSNGCRPEQNRPWHGCQIGMAYAAGEEVSGNARIQKRGDVKDLGDEVPRGFLEILSRETPKLRGSGRLELADWVTDPANPLPARVMVNRIWQHHFGKGLVQTPSDFGKRGTPPTNPELLDYLATRFVEGGWSIKAMHRAIMVSETYQQSKAENAACGARCQQRFPVAIQPAAAGCGGLARFPVDNQRRAGTVPAVRTRFRIWVPGCLCSTIRSMPCTPPRGGAYT